MTVIAARSPKLWAAGVGSVVTLLGHLVLGAPHASATCTLSAQDEQYINLLAQKNMIHGTDVNDCNVVAEGRWFADQVRHSGDPVGTARGLIQKVTETTPMNSEQAEWEVESAIFVYAPEMIPTIKGQFPEQPPE